MRSRGGVVFYCGRAFRMAFTSSATAVNANSNWSCRQTKKRKKVKSLYMQEQKRLLSVWFQRYMLLCIYLSKILNIASVCGDYDAEQNVEVPNFYFPQTFLSVIIEKPVKKIPLALWQRETRASRPWSLDGHACLMLENCYVVLKHLFILLRDQNTADLWVFYPHSKK